LYSPLFLASYAKLPISELEEQEDLEQLRVLSAGYRIKVLRVGEHAGIAVDTPGQLSFLKSQWA
jgi:3-deoxy-manno-octulosonate cytidylyltransferase (CMP-KDO synthetase)